MGLCHDFGSPIAERCNHPMRAGRASCTCDICGIECHGLFDGCSAVWARGPHPILAKAVPLPDATGGANVSGKAALSADGSGSAQPPTDPDSPDGEPVPEAAVDPQPEDVDDPQPEAVDPAAVDPAAVDPAAVDPAAVDPEAVGQALARDLAARLSALEVVVTSAIDGLRQELREGRQSQERSIVALRDAVVEAMLAADARWAALKNREAARVRALKASVGKELAPVAGAVAESAAQSEAILAELVDAMADSTARSTSLLTALAQVVADGAAQSTAELASLRRRVDRLARAGATREAAPAATLALAPSPGSGVGPVAAVLGPAPAPGVRVSLRDGSAGSHGSPQPATP